METAEYPRETFSGIEKAFSFYSAGFVASVQCPVMQMFGKYKLLGVHLQTASKGKI